MPLAPYRSFIGISKDAPPTSLTAAVAAGATSIPISGTGVPASSTITIWDGPLTEQRAVTAGGGTSTLTVAALTNAHPANVYVTYQLTASQGPADYIPITAIDTMDNIGQLEDKGLRGSAATTFGYVQGVGSSEVNLGGDAFPDTVPYLIGGILGATDFSGGTPNSHAFSVKNTGDTQPTPYTFWDFDVANTRGFSALKWTDLGFNFDGESLLTWTAKGIANRSGIVTTPTSSFGTLPPMAVWTGLVTIGGTAVSTLISGNINFKRNGSDIQTIDTAQDPYKLFLGPLSVDGRLTFVMEDDTELLRYLNNTQPSLDIKFTTGSGAGLVSITFHMTKANYTTAKPADRLGDYTKMDVSFTAVANTTDATTAGTGYSPIKVTVQNAKATGTYL